MKLLLISPERERKKAEAFLFRLGFLNLPYVAAVTPPDVEVRMIDEAYEDVNFEEKADLVGITAQTPAAPRAYLIAKEFKKIYRGDGFADPARLPLPKRDLLKERFYLPLKLLETTRGCPHHCDFCGVSRFFGFRYRNRPISEIDRELKALFPEGSLMNPIPKKILSLFSKDLPYFLKRRLLYIIDSNIAGDKRFCLDLLSLLKE